MVWNNAIFDAAFDRLGLRERIDVVNTDPPLHFQADFQSPQEIDATLLVHTTFYEIEFTTQDVRGLVVAGALLDVPAGSHQGRYRVRQPPQLVGDGYWTRAQLERIA
jgi:hypothetical protein